MNYEKKLIVFDWDGTLMDSQARIVNSFRAAIRDLRLEERSEQQLSDIIGLGFREALLALYPNDGEGFHADLVERYRHYFMFTDETPSQLFDGVEALLEDLNRQNYFIAIATGKGRKGLDHALVDNRVQHLFHASRCADEARSKPHPQMLEELMDYFAVEAEETVMIGDTEYDLQMALNAGTDGVAVSYGVHEQERLQKLNPLACVHSINELHTWMCTNLINLN